MASRIFIQEGIADKFIGALKSALEGASASGAIGDPMDKNTMVGPLADKSQFDRVMSFIESGKKDGQLITGGTRKGDKGNFVEPTIIKNASSTSQIVQNEVFGPVATVQTFKTEEEAIEMANDSTFGLSGESGPSASFCIRS